MFFLQVTKQCKQQINCNGKIPLIGSTGSMLELIRKILAFSYRQLDKFNLLCDRMYGKDKNRANVCLRKSEREDESNELEMI